MARGEFTEESDMDVLVVLDNIANHEDELKTLLKEYKRTRVAGILKKTKEHEVP